MNSIVNYTFTRGKYRKSRAIHTVAKMRKIQHLRAIELLIQVSHISQEKRINHLARTSVEIDMIRVFLRLALDIKAIDKKKNISPYKHK